jgi:hypothetical protein
MWQLGGAQEGLTFDFWMLDKPQKDLTSPSKGLDVSLLLIYVFYLAINVKNNMILVCSLVGYFFL